MDDQERVYLFKDTVFTSFDAPNHFLLHDVCFQIPSALSIEDLAPVNPKEETEKSLYSEMTELMRKDVLDYHYISSKESTMERSLHVHVLREQYMEDAPNCKCRLSFFGPALEKIAELTKYDQLYLLATGGVKRGRALGTLHETVACSLNLNEVLWTPIVESGDGRRIATTNLINAPREFFSGNDYFSYQPVMGVELYKKNL